ncbi:MAG: hypothetical protein MJZ26_14890 [Fibrobacter sp.]|nr:hypothetical protein [Fibrobacter sp.]
MKKEQKEDLTIEVFTGLQDMARRTNAKASITLDRPDGWQWKLEVIPPEPKGEVRMPIGYETDDPAPF